MRALRAVRTWPLSQISASSRRRIWLSPGPAMRQPEPVRTKVKDSRASTGLASWPVNLYLTWTDASCTCSAR